MLSQLLSGNFNRYTLISLLLQIPVVLFSLSLHETAHGYVAYKMGDPTARNLGRLTLNPIKHLDPLGALCMLLLGYGWANPVPINTRNFKNPKKGMALTALAGPVSNLLLALVLTVLNSFVVIISVYIPQTENSALMLSIVYMFFYTGVYLNVSLAVFNLLPVPPFDGSRIFLALLPPKLYFGIMKYERYILIAVLALLYVGLLSGPIDFITDCIFDLFNYISGLIIGLLT